MNIKLYPGKAIRYAINNTAVLERKIRGLGIHACGFIVANDPITNWAPISTVSIEDSNGNDEILRCVHKPKMFSNSITRGCRSI